MQFDCRLITGGTVAIIRAIGEVAAMTLPAEMPEPGNLNDKHAASSPSPPTRSSGITDLGPKLGLSL
ncbi:MAG: hypothetical protein CMM60_03735 [Rhodospirillaceae bacterium]|jgi:hypothetical protein|nr:hypothetical protein [Rhodospirillaceae bacterium]